MIGRPPYHARIAVASILAGHWIAVPSLGRAQEASDSALGVVDFPVSCSEPAQAAFEHAVALLHHMTYPEAQAAFIRITELDARCAMAHWGIAMTLFQPAWPTRPGPEELERGWEEVENATRLGPPTERERMWVASARAFFEDPASTDHWARIRRWERAMGALHEAFPDDDDASALYALAHLAAAPADADSARARSARAADLLLGVYAHNPEHPGAMHYLIHANDRQGREHESLDIVREYETIAPRNPHALHMPTHIYTRLGDWGAVIRGNLLAAEAALEHPAGEHGELVWDEFPHAIEYLVYAYLQQGADDRAAAQIERLLGTPRLQPSFKTAFHLASTRARYVLERRAWAEAASTVPREPATLDWDRYTWPEAIQWFARGLGAVHTGELEETRGSIRRLGELERAATTAGEELWARNIRVLRLEEEAWLAHARGEGEASVTRMREAAELEVSTPKHPVTPAPTLPAHELLGDLLLERGEPAAALAAYTRALELYPRRFDGLLGAARAARATGEDDAARAYYRALLEVAVGSARQDALEEARAFLGDR